MKAVNVGAHVAAATVVFLMTLFPIGVARAADGTERAAAEARQWPIFRGDRGLTGHRSEFIPRTLEPVWTFKADSALSSSPVLSHDRVYIGSSEGTFYALSLEDGGEAWTATFDDSFEAAPLLVDDYVIIGGLSGTLYAMDRSNGRIRWRYEAENRIAGSANWAQLPNGKKIVLAGSYDTRVHAVWLATGEKVWSYETGSYINGTPAVNGERVVVGGCDALVHVLNIDDGSLRMEIDVGSYIPGSAAVADGRAYVGHYGNQTVCVDINGGFVVWEYGDAKNGSPFFASPAVNENVVVVGSRDKAVHCIARQTGDKLWTARTRGDVDSSPVIAGNCVVTASGDGRVYLFDLATGADLWSYEIGAPIIACPAVLPDGFVIAADDGRVYRFADPGSTRREATP